MDAPYYEPLISYPRISLDLDDDLDILVNKKGAALREALEGRPIWADPVISDPIKVLLGRVNARKAV